MIHDIEGTNVTTGDTDWRAADPPVCPTCNTDHSYWPWEMRDQYRATMRENAALRERVTRLRSAYTLIEAVLIARTERSFMRSRNYPRRAWAFDTARQELRDLHRENAGLQPGDLDDPATPGTEAER